MAKKNVWKFTNLGRVDISLPAGVKIVFETKIKPAKVFGYMGINSTKLSILLGDLFTLGPCHTNASAFVLRLGGFNFFYYDWTKTLVYKRYL